MVQIYLKVLKMQLAGDFLSCIAILAALVQCTLRTSLANARANYIIVTGSSFTYMMPLIKIHFLVLF
jgi:hypothetical protein